MKHTASNQTTRRRLPALLAASLLALAVTFPPAAFTVPIMKILELSREGALVTYSVGETGFGKAVVSKCDTCGEKIELDITPQTRLIVGGKEVSFRDYPTADQSRVTVFYLPDENRLTRIVASSLSQ